MDCPACRTSNASGLKYCIRCGRNLENSQEANYEKVGMSGYHTEEEYLQEKNEFKIAGSTFTINDKSYISSELFTLNELNALDETDFGERDEALISKPYADKLSDRNMSVSIDDIKSKYVNNEKELDFGGRDEPLLSKPYTDSFSGKTQSARDMQSNYIKQSENELDFGGRDEPLVSNPYTDSFSGKTQSARDMQSNYIKQSENELDFGGRDEPLVSNPYTDSFSGKTQSARDMQSNYIKQSENELDFGGRDKPLVSQPVSVQQNNVVNSYPLPSPPYMSADPRFNQIYGVPAVNEVLPQIIGYDPNGMPIYTQPAVTYAPPQIIGYDPNGMPIYAQSPVTYAPPQIMGYDPSGMPIYAQQPVLYQQPSMPQFQPVSEQLPKNQNADSVSNDISDKFRDFIDDGKNRKKPENDFFGKSSDMGDVSVAGLDVGSLKKRDNKKKNYMNETPLVNADGLVPNNASKFNKMYMKQTEKVNAENLEEKKTYGANHIMRTTKAVDANRLNAKKSYKSYMTMSGAGEADASELEAYVPKAKKAIMAEADHAVEAIPKKKPKYIDELDKIELPEYMQAKKTVKNDTPEIPGLPEL